MRTKIEDLRNHLFASLERLNDETHAVDLEREKTLLMTARGLVELAKVEVDYLKVTNETADANAKLEFFEKPAERLRIGVVK